MDGKYSSVQIKNEIHEDILTWEPNCLDNDTPDGTLGTELKPEFKYQIKEEVSDNVEICLNDGRTWEPNDEKKLIAIEVKPEFINETKIEISDEYYFPETMINTPQCVTCEMKFLKDQELNAHYQHNESHKPKRYNCLKCPKTFDFLYQLRDHKTVVHSEGDSKLTKLFKCNICEKAFCHPLSLQEHTMVHTGEKPFTCAQCGQKFFTNYAMASHQSRHKDPSPKRKITNGWKRRPDNCLIIHRKYNKFVCVFCGEKFNTKLSLIDHLKRHEGLRIYKCPVCDERFTTSQLLSSHQCPDNNLVVDMSKPGESIRSDIANYSDEEFIKYFRIKKSTFSYILSLINVQIDRNKKNIMVFGELQLQMALWYFSKPSHFKFIYTQLNIAHSTALNSVRRVVNALYDLAPSIISWPKREQLSEVRHGFNEMGLTNVIGSIGTTYVCTYSSVQELAFNPATTQNGPCVILQAVCDHTLKFISCHATMDVTSNKVLMESDVWKFMDTHAYNQDRDNKFSDGAFLVGDPSYPCLPQLMTPYVGTLTDEQEEFNKMLFPGINMIAKAMYYLKKRFRCLEGVLDIRKNSSEWAPKYTIACCVLHNICIMLDDLVDDSFTEPVEFDSNISYDFSNINQERLHAGMQRRNEICEMFQGS